MIGEKHSHPQRGEIYWVNLDPAQGSETKKKRPGLIVSNNVGNQHSDVVMIAPITSKVVKIFQFEVATTVDGKKAKIMLNQCRAVDKSRLSGKLGELDAAVMKEVENAIKIVFALS